MRVQALRTVLLLLRLSAALLFAAPALATAAGIADLEVPGGGGEPPLRAVVWTPCAQPATDVPRGPLLLRGLVGCPVQGEALPLVVISHGNRGSRFGHHDTAEALADAGFVVAALNHPGNSAGDDSAEQELSIFESRPRDLSRLISHLTGSWEQRARIDAGRIGAFGFSRGGYTVLALAGARPSARASAARFCGAWWSFAMKICRRVGRADARIEPTADPRVRAVVAADPLHLFDTAGLASVRVPVQLWASERGGDGVEPAHVEAVRSALPVPPEFHVAKGAGHFAYLAPCSPALREQERAICTDPEGFDRVAWHRQMNAAVVAFFRRNL